MNIFVLHDSPIASAEFQCDKHIVKMPLETAQMLCTAVHVQYPEVEDSIPYRAAYRNHPCTVWARESAANFYWLLLHGRALCAEYSMRYGRVHKCQQVIEWTSDYISAMPSGSMTGHPLCMPEQYKVRDAVQSYRNYYLGDKARFAKWERSSTPYWWA